LLSFSALRSPSLRWIVEQATRKNSKCEKGKGRREKKTKKETTKEKAKEKLFLVLII
jgi:hypothetical protein